MTYSTSLLDIYMYVRMDVGMGKNLPQTLHPLHLQQQHDFTAQ